MNVAIVGTFNEQGGRRSGYMDKFLPLTCFNLIVNGGNISDLKRGLELVKTADRILWGPDVPNSYNKEYPQKKKGATLICTKFIRTDDPLGEVVPRIFRMHANGCITFCKHELIYSCIIDPLGNVHGSGGTNIANNAKELNDFITWHEHFTRMSFKQSNDTPPQIDEDVIKLIEINKDIAKRCQTGAGSRLFGNLSTRCKKLFPSSRYWFSPRNIDKQYIEPSDMVYIADGMYYGNRKPSIDAPVQVLIYNECQDVNYIIHGHASVENVITTEEFSICGAIEEAKEIIDLYKKGNYIINIKGHGFIILCSTIKQMNTAANTIDLHQYPTIEQKQAVIRALNIK